MPLVRAHKCNQKMETSQFYKQADNILAQKEQ